MGTTGRRKSQERWSHRIRRDPGRGFDIDAKASLAQNDGHGFFEALGDQVVTGPPLTNVNDFREILIVPPTSEVCGRVKLAAERPATGISRTSQSINQGGTHEDNHGHPPRSSCRNGRRRRPAGKRRRHRRSRPGHNASRPGQGAEDRCARRDAGTGRLLGAGQQVLPPRPRPRSTTSRAASRSAASGIVSRSSASTTSSIPSAPSTVRRVC